MVGEGQPAAGSCRFRRPPEACELAPGLENTPQRRVSLESNERNFLFQLVLDRRLFEKRIFPCINIPQSGTRKEEKLYPKEQVEKLYLMRRALSTLSPEAAMELLLQKVREFPTNEEFLASLQLK